MGTSSIGGSVVVADGSRDAADVAGLTSRPS